MKRELAGYKLCKSCGCPMLKKGQRRKHREDYRHAFGCPESPRSERRMIARILREYEKVSGQP